MRHARRDVLAFAFAHARWCCGSCHYPL